MHEEEAIFENGDRLANNPGQQIISRSQMISIKEKIRNGVESIISRWMLEDDTESSGIKAAIKKQ